MCLNPKKIKRDGYYKEDNYRGQAGDKWDIETFTDCGSCSQCIAKRANNWVIRNHWESKSHKEKCFITLTYAHNPLFLVRKDFQDWVKRFRFEINKEYYKKRRFYKKSIKKLDKEIKKEKLIEWNIEHENEYKKVRIFYAGEYGTLKGRPHFHAIIYGWEDKNAYWRGINKKCNIIYESDTIAKTWGLGLTSYQNFGDNETNYIALYSTAQEQFKKSYKMTKDKLNKLNKYLNEKINYYPKMQRVNLLKTLKEIEEEMNSKKKEYYLIKEFNGWSQSLGWENFFDNYAKKQEYTFTEYIWDKQFATPSPWIKKLANKYGDIPAAQEMFKREKDMLKSATEIQEKLKNITKEKFKRKKEILKWQENDRKNGEITEL